MIKKIQIKTKPAKNLTADEWVNNKTGRKKLQVLIPNELFMLFKVDCAKNGLTMSHEVTSMIEKKYEGR